MEKDLKDEEKNVINQLNEVDFKEFEVVMIAFEVASQVFEINYVAFEAGNGFEVNLSEKTNDALSHCTNFV